MVRRDRGTQRTNGGTTTTNALGATTAPKKKTDVAAARRGHEGRSGGVVDAPGKRHRKAAPTDPDANIADSQADKMRMAKTMAKTYRRRGRG